jgi:hypothetical protein
MNLRTISNRSRRFEKLCANGSRVFESRVVVCDDENVAPLGRDAGHIESLRRVAVTVRTENHDGSTRRETSNRRQCVLKRVW